MTIIESEQSREIKLTEFTRGPFVLRFLSYRKSEDAALGLRSEDYIVSDITPEKTIFCLCDGVGSSFYGNIGSQILGEILLSWLGKVPLPANNISLDGLTAELTAELNGRTGFATSIIQKKEISSQNEMVRLAETTQRDDFGTQSNFACGIVWPKSPALPNGLVLLFWLGNARTRLFNQNRDLTSTLGWGTDPDQLLDVWSSKDGVVGTVYAHVTDLSKVTHIIAYSDGLENADEYIRPTLDGKQLEDLVHHSQSVKDDDATFLELSAGNREIPGQADDISASLRGQMRTVSSQPSHADPEVKKLRSALDTLQKKYEAQAQKSTPQTGIFITAASFFMLLCFFLGWVSNPVISGIINPPTETPTPTFTARPTRFRSPTPAITDTAAPSETPTETFTPLPTDTATVLSSETPTSSAETLTVLPLEATTSFPIESPTPSTPSP